MRKFDAAINGVVLAYKDHSIMIQLCFGVIAICIGIVLQISYIQWLGLISAIALVIICETINTAIEKLCNLIDDTYNIKIKEIKDLSAAFVLMAAFYALFVGAWILISYI